MSQWTPPSQAPISYERKGPRQHEPASALALTLAITSLFVWFLPAVVGFAVASGAKRNIAAAEAPVSGRSVAIAAQVISVVAFFGAAAAMAGLYFA